MLRFARLLAVTSMVVMGYGRMASADYTAGLEAFNSGDYATAYTEWFVEATDGNARAQHGLGLLYEIGKGVPHIDAKEAARWYQLAADQNYPPAQSNLARLYADGRGVSHDPTKAIELWTKAAEAGNSTAAYNLAVQYDHGGMVPKDPAKSAQWMLKAAEAGNADAQFELARNYSHGAGVPVDTELAIDWYRKAAAAGHKQAKIELAAIEHAAAAEGGSMKGAATAMMNDAPIIPDALDATEKEEPDQAAHQETASVEQPAQPSEQAAQEVEIESAEKTQTAEVDPAATDDGSTVEEREPIVGDDGIALAESLTGDKRTYRIWLARFGQEQAAQSEWAKLKTKYERILAKLELDIRQYDLGDRGSVYRLFVGPFANREAALRTCEQLQLIYSGQFCKPVIN